MKNSLYWIVPGDIQTHSGGYAYNRQIIKRLSKVNVLVIVIELSANFPFPDADALSDADAKLAAIPTNALVLVDCLALGAMPELAQKHALRLILLGLCHHPLALETGIPPEQADYFRQAELHALEAAYGVLVTSETTADYLVQFYNLPSTKIKIALPGTDTHRFAARRGEPKVLLTVASFIPRKGHDLLLRALEQIQDLPWQARWVGNTQLNPNWSEFICQQLSSSPVAERISWVANSADIAEEYYTADLFVLPSAYEGYGMAFAEALSSGLPIIALAAGAPAQWLPTDACRLLPPGNSQLLAESIRELLHSPHHADTMAAAARLAATSLPTWEQTANTIRAWLNEITNARHKNDHR